MNLNHSKLKYIARLRYGDALSPNESDREGEFEVFGSNGIYSSNDYPNTFGPTIIVGRKGSYGKVNWSPVSCFASDTTFFIDSRNTEHNLRWLFYTLQSLNLDVGSNETAIPGLSREDVYNQYIWLPSSFKQQSIADFLDRETAHLDALIAAKERLLKLLDEKRRALITHAVTHGLDSDVKLRVCSVSWSKRIPVSWQVVRLKYLSESLQTGPFGSQLHAEEYIQGGVPVINPTHLSNGDIFPDENTTLNTETAERLVAHKLIFGDIVFARRGELGRCGLVQSEQEGWICGTGSLRARPKKNLIYPKYLVLYVSNTGVGDWLKLESAGATMDNLNTEILSELSILCPPIEEQRAIVAYIESETKKLDDLKAAANHTINLLKERRTALISAAVTGQLAIGTKP